MLDIIENSCNYGVSKIFIWANSDLDGAASTIMLGNIFPNMGYRAVFFGEFLSQYQQWEDNLDDYDKVFVVGMVLDQQLINKIDDKKLVFISDRNEQIKTYDSTLISEDSTSCVKMLYNKFKDKFQFTTDLKKLVLYVDDYNSYNLKFDESKYLNGLYRTRPMNRFKHFVNRFWNGYDGLTDKEMGDAEHFFEKIDEAYEKLEIFKGKFMDWSVTAAFTTQSVNEMAKKLIDNHSSDVIILVNPDTQFVSFRKPTGSPANIAYMAENLCDGGGSDRAAGGKMGNKKFLEFTNTLTL